MQVAEHLEGDSGRLHFDVEARRAPDANSGHHHEDSDRIAGTSTSTPGKRSLQWLLEACNLDDPDAKKRLAAALDCWKFDWSSSDPDRMSIATAIPVPCGEKKAAGTFLGRIASNFLKMNSGC